ncbi:MAG TPA: hypothetical protein VJP85_02775 [Candidatus Baltobacteraceae bacterium]|nr:hypothetical protein [Candidatus Baltobacteraceae bacterium]
MKQHTAVIHELPRRHMPESRKSGVYDGSISGYAGSAPAAKSGSV